MVEKIIFKKDSFPQWSDTYLKVILLLTNKRLISK